MTNDDYSFINEILIHLAHRDILTLEVVYEKAVKHNKTDDYMEYIGNLMKDGYLVEQNRKYIFISPFLKAYWKHNNPIYNG